MFVLLCMRIRCEIFVVMTHGCIIILGHIMKNLFANIEMVATLAWHDIRLIDVLDEVRVQWIIIVLICVLTQSLSRLCLFSRTFLHRALTLFAACLIFFNELLL